MSLESTPSEAFLGNDAPEDDLASLDLMGFTSGSHSQQFGMNTVLLPGGSGGDYAMSMNSSGSHHVGSASAASEEREGGLPNASGSLFDRIRARTAEQQKLSSSNHSTQSSSNQAAAQQSSQQQYYPQLSENAFVPQQQPPPSISGEPSHNIMANYSNNNNNNKETTYSFSASGGAEDFSQQTSNTHNVPHIPVYGASRDDPYYIAVNNANHHHHPTNFQDKATIALAQTGETMKSIWHVGVSGAQYIGAMAKDRMMGGSGYERTHGNNFLLREEGTLEQGGGGSATMNQSAGTTTTTAGSASADQAYSMLQYGKTFFADVIGFVRQLPSWGQGIVGVILLWVLYVLFG